MTKAEWIQVISSVAVVLNSMVLWPMMRAFKAKHSDHESRLSKLEDK